MKLIFLLLITFQVSYGQDCKTRAANKPSELVRWPQDYYDRSYSDAKSNISTAKMKTPLTIAENWIKGVLKGFTGAKLVYSNEYLFGYESGLVKEFYKNTGIKGSYDSKMRFFEYYCYEGRDQIFTEGESGSFVTVHFNNVFMSLLCSSVGVYTINGKNAFRLFEKSSSEGRIDYYEQIAMANDYDTIYKSKNEYIIIRNSDKPVFLTITRKEYLQQLLKDVDDYKNRETGYAKAAYTPATEAANKASFEDQLKRIDNSKNYTPEQMAPYRKRFIETWETEKQKFEKRIAKLEKETAEAKEVLQEYMKKGDEWLNRSFKDFYGYSAYSGNGMRDYLEKLDKYIYPKEEESRTYVAYLNPAYFNNSLGAEVPQLIAVRLAKKSYPHMQKVSKLVKRPGALMPLVNLLTPGKQPKESPPIISGPTYRLSYLPKSDRIIPLTVPADMHASVVPVMPVNNAPAAAINFNIPPKSPKLTQLPAQPFTSDTYRSYVLELYTTIDKAIKPTIKKAADDYLASKKLTSSKDISKAGFAAWLQKTPEASLYLYSKAVANDPADVLAANNFSAFLMMSGLPEKSIPILEYWNKQKPGEAILLANIGNAYYRLGDVDKAMRYLQQCVQKDSLHATANKLLCAIYLKKGDTKKAEEHGTRSITKSHDEQVIAILRQLNNKVKPGEIMSRFPPLPAKEFPMLQRIKLPVMPANLEDMAEFNIELKAIQASIKMTIAAIEEKHPPTGEDVQQQMLMASFKGGISPIRIKAQHIIMDGLQIYQSEMIKEADVFNYQVKKLGGPYNARCKAIQKKYNEQLKTLEGGEAGDEDKIAALELSQCKELNNEKQGYLSQLSGLVNQYAQRQEYISRKFCRDYANWAPYWMSGTTISFPSIEIDYLKDISNILSQYPIISKMECLQAEPLPEKEDSLEEWEEEYCANFKGKIQILAVKLFWTCNSWGVEGGEGIVGAVEVNYSNGGEFEDFTIEGGLGATMHLAGGQIAKVEGGATVKEFIKIGKNKATGAWEVQDFGVKGELSAEGEIGPISSEVKLIESTIAVNAGINITGVIAPLLPIK